MPYVKKGSAMAGVGCLLQGLGLVGLVAAVLTLPTIIGPLVLGPLGLWLVHEGGKRASWWECSDCGTRLAGKHINVCPACRGEMGRG